MYRAAYNSHTWLLTQMMNHGNPPPPYSLTFYAGSPDIFPIMNLDPSVTNPAALLPTPTTLDLANMEYSLKKSIWNKKGSDVSKSVSASSNNYQWNYGHGGRYRPSAVPNNTGYKNGAQRQTDGMKFRGSNVSVKAPVPDVFVAPKSHILKSSSQTMDSKGVKRQLDASSTSGSSRSPSPNSSKEPCHFIPKRKPLDNQNSVPSKDGNVNSCASNTIIPEKLPLLPLPTSATCEVRLNECEVAVQNAEFEAAVVMRDSQEMKCEMAHRKRELQFLLSNCATAPPETLLHSNEWDLLSCEIWKKYSDNKQSEEMYNRKMRLRDVLYHILSSPFPGCGLYVVGSSMNGFGCDTSDIDMCLMLRHHDIDQKFDAVNILKHIQKVFKQCDFVHKVELIRAKVPILKFTDSVSGVEVDLNVNNSVGIRNTHLLNSYSKLDWRVCPLILVIKLWARAFDINDAKNMTISSYSLTLMVIHYLQDGIKPPVLPSLQQLFPSKFLPDSNIGCLVLDENLDIAPSNNNQSIGELLVGFFNYFSNVFRFDDDAISIRLGKRVSKRFCQFQKSMKNHPGQWKCLSIEEPFDLSNTARSVYDSFVFEKVKKIFRDSYQSIEKAKSLNSILSS